MKCGECRLSCYVLYKTLLVTIIYTSIKLEEINASFKRKKVPFGWEIYPKKDIKKIDDYITQVRSLFAANNYPELPNYYRYSTNLNHTLISGEKLKTLREQFNIGK